MPVDSLKVRAKEGEATIPIRMRWTPKRAGEVKLSLRVKPQPGELLPSNNEVSTFVTVLGGGLNRLVPAGVSILLGVSLPDPDRSTPRIASRSTCAWYDSQGRFRTRS